MRPGHGPGKPVRVRNRVPTSGAATAHRSRTNLAKRHPGRSAACGSLCLGAGGSHPQPGLVDKPNVFSFHLGSHQQVVDSGSSSHCYHLYQVASSYRVAQQHDGSGGHRGRGDGGTIRSTTGTLRILICDPSGRVSCTYPSTRIMRAATAGGCYLSTQSRWGPHFATR